MIRRNIIFLTITIVAVLGLGALASVVGNVNIRRISSQDSIVLLASEPLIPGVTSLIRWNAPEDIQANAVTIAIQGENFSQDLATVDISDAAASILIPCSTGGETVGVVMKHASNEELISWREFQVLPAGPDCF